MQDNKITLKNFLIVSVIFHIVMFFVFVGSENTKKETIVINMDEIQEDIDILEVNEVTDDAIYKRMQEMELEEKENINKSLEFYQQEKELLKIEKKLSTLKKESLALKKENTKTIKQLRRNESDLSKQKGDIKKIKDNVKKLKNEKKKLDSKNKKLNIKNKTLDKEIELKKKEDKIKKDKQKAVLYKSILRKYVSNITVKFRRNWVIPISAESEGVCTVTIIQDRRGNLVDTDIKKNCPIDPDFVRSIKKAIDASTPLPRPPKELNFKDIREITLEFKLNF